MRSSFVALSLVALLCSVAVIDARSFEKRSIFDDLAKQAQDAFQKWAPEAQSAVQQKVEEAQAAWADAVAKIQASVQEQVNKGRQQFDDVVPQIRDSLIQRIQEVTKAVNDYIKENEGKVKEAQQLLLDNAVKALGSAEDRVNQVSSQTDDAAKQALQEVIKGVDNLEKQVVNEINAPKTRSAFSFNWEGLRSVVEERLNQLGEQLKPIIQQAQETGRDVAAKVAQQAKDQVEKLNQLLQNAGSADAQGKLEAVKEVTQALDDIRGEIVPTEQSVRAKRSVFDDIVKAISGDEATRKYLTDKVEELKKQVDSLVKQGADNFSSAKDQALEQAKKQLENFENELKENAPKFQQDAQKALESFGQQVNSAGDQAQEAVKNFFDNLQKQIPQQQ